MCLLSLQASVKLPDRLHAGQAVSHTEGVDLLAFETIPCVTELRAIDRLLRVRPTTVLRCGDARYKVLNIAPANPVWQGSWQLAPPAHSHSKTLINTWPRYVTVLSVHILWISESAEASIVAPLSFCLARAAGCNKASWGGSQAMLCRHMATRPPGCPSAAATAASSTRGRAWRRTACPLRCSAAASWLQASTALPRDTSSSC